MNPEFIQISDELFLKIGKLITARYGIKMPPDKKIMFQARLQKRLHELKIYSFGDYAAKLFDNGLDSDELDVIADFISTNKTEFFREKDHFDFLANHVLPELTMHKQQVIQPDLAFWSAGCSNGQEAYSLVITLEEFKRLQNVCFNYSVLATDISVRMLREAKTAVYQQSHIQAFSIEMKRRYFLKSKDPNDSRVRVAAKIREKVRIARLNLMEQFYSLDRDFDVIFLRNTLIYFGHAVQFEVLTKVVSYLKPGGYLFIGHSESLINLHLPIRPVAPSVYVKISS